MRVVSSSPSMLKNKVLAALRPQEWEILHRAMAPVRLVAGQILVEANQVPEQTFFLEGGLACLVTASGEKTAQVAMVGPEGMVGGLSPLWDEPCPACAIMHIPGPALRISTDALRSNIDRCPTLRDGWLQHLHALTAEVMQTAADNACSTLDQRCARWILSAHARVEGDELPITHETLAALLGVFRSGITVAISALQERRLIGTGRGRVIVLDAAGLRDFVSRPTRPRGQRPAAGRKRSGADHDVQH